MTRGNAFLDWSMLACAILSNTAASLALKWAGHTRDPSQPLLSYSSMGNLGIMGVALVFYGASFLAYMIALRAFPVSIAYPIITGSSILAIMISASIVFNEPISPTSLLGTALILSGVAILTNQMK